MKQIIPCALHIVMGVTLKLFTLLLRETRGNTDLAKKWEKLLAMKCNIHLEPERGGTLYEHWERARISRPEALAILTHYQLFVNELKEKWPTSQQPRDIELIWKQYHELVSLLVQANVSITEKQWRDEAKELGRAIIKLYGREEITPYLHVFIYHVGYFLEHYGGIEKYGNYALEGKHSTNKRILTKMTSRFKYGAAGAVKQQLLANMRIEQHQYKGFYNHIKKRHGRQKVIWAVRTLEVCPRLSPFVISSDIIEVRPEDKP